MALLLMLQKKFFRHFMDGRRGPWGVFAIGIFGLRTLRKWIVRREEIAFRTKLKPGETIQIENTMETPKSLKKERRASKRAARRARVA